MKWELRPVRSPDQVIVVREVYYNIDNEICDIEMTSCYNFYPDTQECIMNLKPNFPDVETFNRYNDTILTYNPEKTKLADWKFKNL